MLIRSAASIALLTAFLSGCPADRAPPDAGAPPPKPDAATPPLVKTSTVTTTSTLSSNVDANVVQAMNLARAKLERWVKGGASDPGNGWALAHGLVGYGRDLQAGDGRLAIEAIASNARVVP